MGLFKDIGSEFFPNSRFFGGGFGSTYYGTTESWEEGVKEAKGSGATNISAVYTCAKILSETMSMMPMSVSKDGKPLKKHKLYYNIRHRMNDVQNNNTLWSTVEYMKNIYGNAFIDLRKGVNRIIPIEVVEDWDFKGAGDTLRYKLNWACTSDYPGKASFKSKGNNGIEWVASKDVLHIKGLSVDGVMGLPPVSAAIHNLNIMSQATQTIESFYKNRALSPMSLESTLPDSASAGKQMIDQVEKFKSKYSGVRNAGKPIFLPPNTRLNPLQIHFQDAQLIDTMAFTRDEIFSMYSIPKFMYGSSETIQMDIEQQTRSFISFCISGKAAGYKAELEYKLLSKEEVVSGIVIEFDTMALIQSDFVSLSTAFKGLIQAGAASPNMASEALGLEKSNEPYSDQRFVQAQLIALSDYSQANPIINNKAETKPEEKKDDKTKPKE